MNSLRRTKVDFHIKLLLKKLLLKLLLKLLFTNRLMLYVTAPDCQLKKLDLNLKYQYLLIRL